MFGKLIPLFEEYKYFNDVIYSGDYVNQHIKHITPDVNDLPDYFMKKLIKPRKIFRWC